MTGGPLNLMYQTNLEAAVAGATPFDPEDMSRFRQVYQEIQPLRLKRRDELDSACAKERLLAETKSTISESLTRLTGELQALSLSSWDEYADNVTCCDFVLLAGRLEPMEYQVKFLSNTRDRLDVRIDAARITSRTATVEVLKVEYLEAQVLCAISVLETEVLLAPVREKVGGVLAFSVRSQQLQAAAAEKKRELNLADRALADEIFRQRIIAEQAIATGTVTRAQIASAIG